MFLISEPKSYIVRSKKPTELSSLTENLSKEKRKKGWRFEIAGILCDLSIKSVYKKTASDEDEEKKKEEENKGDE